MSDSKSGSSSKLNESNMPLLESEEKEGNTPEKEEVELVEKKDEEKQEEPAEEKKEKKEKKKKEKKEKVKKEGPSCAEKSKAYVTETLNAVDMAGFDANSTEIDLDFDSVLAEPYQAQGLDGVRRLSFLMSSSVRIWIYRILAALIAIPLSLVWGLVFSLLMLVFVWLIRPLLRIMDFVLDIIKKVVRGVIGATVAPVCEAFGLCFHRRPTSLIQGA